MIDEILWLLKDGKWHNLREIAEKCSLPLSEVEMAANFLWESNFIQVRGNRQKAKLRSLMLKFIQEIQRIEKEEASGHKGFKGAVGIKEFSREV